MIRPWTEEDLDPLIAMGQRFYNEAEAYNNFEFSPYRIMQSFFAVMKSTEQVGLCYEKDGIKGAIAGAIYPQFFSKGLTASELFVFVEPTTRGGVIGKRLINAFEQWANSMGASEIRLGVSAGIATKRTVGLYEKLGYTPTATQLRKVL